MAIYISVTSILTTESLRLLRTQKSLIIVRRQRLRLTPLHLYYTDKIIMTSLIISSLLVLPSTITINVRLSRSLTINLR